MTNELNVDHGRIRDQLGSSYGIGTDANQSGNVNLIVIPPFKNDVLIEQLPSQWSSRLIGTAFILGHAANGILGTSALGAGTLGSYVVNWVVSDNNAFIDYFKDTVFNDSANSTASWDTTNSRWEFISGDIGRTLAIFLNQQAVTQVKLGLDVEGISVFDKIDLIGSPGGKTINIT